jgi:hypothetical protein
MVTQRQNSIDKEESSTTTEPNMERVNNEENLQDELDRLRIELSNYKSQQKPAVARRKDEDLHEPINKREG